MQCWAGQIGPVIRPWTCVLRHAELKSPVLIEAVSTDMSRSFFTLSSRHYLAMPSGTDDNMAARYNPYMTPCSRTPSQSLRAARHGQPSVSLPQGHFHNLVIKHQPLISCSIKNAGPKSYISGAMFVTENSIALGWCAGSQVLRKLSC